jgi:hypothetical protein
MVVSWVILANSIFLHEDGLTPVEVVKLTYDTDQVQGFRLTQHWFEYFI